MTTRPALVPSIPALTLGLLSALLGGCATQPRQMPLPDALRSTPPRLVAERGAWQGSLADESFMLGASRVSEVRRSARGQQQFSLGGFAHSTQTESYAYRVDASSSWAGRCDYQDKASSLSLGRSLKLADRQGHLSCVCESGAEQARLELDDEWRPVRGELHMAGQVHSLRQIAERHVVDGQLEAPGLQSPALGYWVGEGAGAIAAVEVLRPGRVWVDARLPAAKDAALSCLLSGLLLWGPQDSH